MNKFIFKMFCTFIVLLSKILLLIKNSPIKMLTFFAIILMVMSTYLLDTLIESFILSIIFIVGSFISHYNDRNLNKYYHGDKKDSKNNISIVIDNQIRVLDYVEPIKGIDVIVNKITVLRTGEISSNGNGRPN